MSSARSNFRMLAAASFISTAICGSVGAQAAPSFPGVEEALGRKPEVGRWIFSTNGVATAGMFGVPTVGFGPGNEIYAHTPEDQCPIEHLTRAARFYAAFPGTFLEAAKRGPGWRRA